VNYYLNYTYISTTLCENKDKPQMHCNGKCHLQKTIEKNQETKDKDAPAISKISAFQEVPGRTLKIGFNTSKDLNTLTAYIAQRYLSPELEILSPPPQSGVNC
jgi:hypothetical protein